ncbi:uncharacterized protein LOC117564359 [Drosophila albomicans]|uniref:Uncharacterized protein LOC117564359 n=1 Tax=Drosophila albomicans TaxID=7291 RepID=A0A6P8W6A7_DROAB|nr:uncharacterized protein LOC117564359 [Drosophila albomicans]
MSLSTALIPQQCQPCNRQTAKIFARIFEQRHGHWSFMKNRSICGNSTSIVERPATSNSIVKCGSSTLQTLQKSPSFLQLQQRQKPFALTNEEYRIYPQSVDLDAFFGAEQKCEKVSDVCLLNDHFILVKMPHVEQQSQVPKTPPKPPDVQSKFGAKLPRCFKCNRGSRVSPILEELEAEQPNSTWHSSDDHDVEIFDSQTRIISAQHQQQLQAISSPLTRPLPESVIVEQPQPLRQIPDPSLQLQLDTFQSPPPPLPVVADALQVSRGPLDWFLWPFRRRSCSRPKAQLAAVHKTYFVRWNKPPDTLWHGYGVERTEVDKVGLRRCRSAIF